MFDKKSTVPRGLFYVPAATDVLGDWKSVLQDLVTRANAHVF